MKFGRYLTLFASLILLPLSAFAKNNNEGKLTLADPAEIGTTHLNPGTYKVAWTGSGPDVQVTVMKGKQTVATTTGQLKTDDQGVTQDAVVTTAASDNSGRQITEIDFGGKKEALILAPNTTTPGSGQ